MDYWFKFDVEKFQRELENGRKDSLSGVPKTGDDTKGRSEASPSENRLVCSEWTSH
jgi:hypothetical protein